MEEKVEEIQMGHVRVYVMDWGEDGFSIRIWVNPKDERTEKLLDWIGYGYHAEGFYSSHVGTAQEIFYLLDRLTNFVEIEDLEYVKGEEMREGE